MKKLVILLLPIILISCGKDADQTTEGQTNLGGGEVTAPVELIVNGSFEEGHNLGDNQWNVFSEITGWKADLDAINAPIEIQNGQTIGGLAPSDGDAKLELDSHAKNGFTASDAHVYQEIETQVGSKYNLKLDYSPRTENCINSCIIEVYWDDVRVAELDSSEKGWKSYSFELDGTGEKTRLEFRAYEDNNTIGGYLDNVSMMIK